MRRAAAALLVLGFIISAPLAAHSQSSSQSDEPLVIPISQYDGTLTPYTFELAYPLVTLIYDTLMWRDEEGIPRPWLARSMSVSPDGRQVTLKLQEGVRWHDGEPLTASDVAFTFGFMRDHYHPRFTPQLAAIASVSAANTSTVVIELEHRALGFADLPLADLPILPRHLWEGLGGEDLAPDGLPVGSGPYRLTGLDEGDGYRLEANARYFKGSPQVDAIEVPVERSFDETLELLRAGDADMLPVSLPEDEAARLEGPTISISRGTLYLGTVLMFNLRRPPFDNTAVRRALAQAVNLEGTARAARNATPAHRGYLHPGSEWAVDEPLHSYDPSAARSRLETLDVPPFEVLAPDNDPLAIVAGRQVAIQLEAAGLEIELKRLRPRALATAVGQDGATADFDAAIWRSPALASYDPDFLRPLFGSDPELSRLNYSGYASDAFDRAAERVASAAAPEERRRFVAEELRVLASEVPHIPLFFADGEFAYRPGSYRNWVYVDGKGILDKRSFLGASGRGAEPQATAPNDAAVDDPEPVPGGRRPATVIVLVLLGLAAALGLGAFIYTRS